MDESKKPRSREKKVVSGGKGVEKRGEGLGTGPLNNTGSYADRKPQSPAAQTPQQTHPVRPAASGGASSTGASRPVGNQAGSPFTQQRPQQTGSSRPAGNQTGSPFTQQRPQQTGSSRPVGNQAGSPFTQQRPQQTGSSRPAGNQTGSPFTQQRPQQTGSSRPTGVPFTQQRPQQTGSSRPAGSTGGSSGPTRSGGGGGGKLILIIIAAVVLLGGGGGLSGLFGNLLGGDGGSTTLPAGTSTYSTQTGSSSSGSSVLDSLVGSSTGSSSSGASVLDSLVGSSTGSSSGSGLTDLLSAFMGSTSSSAYDFGGDPLSLLTGNGSAGNFFSFGSSSSGAGTASGSSGSSSSSASSVPASLSASVASSPDTSVSKKARDKFTVIKGNNEDIVTILVYLCGTDLESQNGMGTSDLKEMASATLGKNINLIVYTGGCKRWRNNVLSSSVNQIYQIQDGKLYCLEKDMGSASMTNPATLTQFIRYGAENFPANRMCLILWDHGGGSVSGYGYDEKYVSSGSMSLAGINTALKNAGQKFDFIGFDACLMATVENGIMLSQYADYMIASEETEPGVGWYYTNWLTQLGKNPGMSTVEIGKRIADDFVEVCNRQCRGQATTLSMVDLAELQATVPSELTSFSKDTSELIQNNEYKTVSSARSKTREFAQSTRIDQIDLVHFANNMGTAEGKNLAKALQGAVKYNRTGGSMSNAYGLSIYFPYKRSGKVNQMVSTYQAIGMDEEYTRCIQEFASLELSGQAAAGTSMSGYDSDTIGMPSLLNSLLGGYGGSPSGYSGISSSSSDMTDLLGSLFGGGSSSSGDLFSLFSGRSLSAEQTAEYLASHHLDVSALVWSGDRITLSDDQWDQVESLARNVFVDDGKGYIDMGMDAEFTIEDNALVDDYDGTWLSIDGQPVAYYYLNTVEAGDEYAISGYIPALLNDIRVNLILIFDTDHPYGYIAGASPVYAGGETEVQAKNLIQIGQGDRLQFLCEYYDYEGNSQDTYYLGEPLTLGAETEIANTAINDKPLKVTYCFTDYYQQRYWTPAVTWGY